MIGADGVDGPRAAAPANVVQVHRRAVASKRSKGEPESESPARASSPGRRPPEPGDLNDRRQRHQPITGHLIRYDDPVQAQFADEALDDKASGQVQSYPCVRGRQPGAQRDERPLPTYPVGDLGIELGSVALRQLSFEVAEELVPSHRPIIRHGGPLSTETIGTHTIASDHY